MHDFIKRIEVLCAIAFVLIMAFNTTLQSHAETYSEELDFETIRVYTTEYSAFIIIETSVETKASLEYEGDGGEVFIDGGGRGELQHNHSFVTNDLAPGRQFSFVVYAEDRLGRKISAPGLLITKGEQQEGQTHQEIPGLEYQKIQTIGEGTIFIEGAFNQPLQAGVVYKKLPDGPTKVLPGTGEYSEGVEGIMIDNLESGVDYRIRLVGRDTDGNWTQATPKMYSASSGDQCVDYDGDGYGWDGKKSCKPSGDSYGKCVDHDGDGWGWDGTRGCKLGQETTTSINVCVDNDGDGWGWNGYSTCIAGPHGEDISHDIPEKSVVDEPQDEESDTPITEIEPDRTINGLEPESGEIFDDLYIYDYLTSDANLKTNGLRQDGSARFLCMISHFSYNDPVVHPGNEGKAHLHMFFGNTLTDHNSTFGTLSSTGNGSCAGGPLNRSGYWIPALHDTGKNVRIPQYTEVYYKSGPLHGQTINTPREGLKMIAGKASARSEGENDGVYEWYCGWPRNGLRKNVGKLIPNCQPGEWLALKLVFPQCWDGANIDSADHRSHMSYPKNGKCPGSHPIAIPEITYNVYWNNSDSNTDGWYLSSDHHEGMGMKLPGGTTTHGDWVGAWHPGILNTLVSQCNNKNNDCIGGTIGPGMKMDMGVVGKAINNSDIHNENLGAQKIPFNEIDTYFR